MKTDAHGSSDTEQQRLDRVIITAAVKALYGPAARVRKMTRASADRQFAWTRQGRLTIQNSHALAAVASVFDRGRP